MTGTINKEKILNVIDNYLKEENIGGAILIDGKWGTGKTYFIEKQLIKNKREYKRKYGVKDIIYISLYGINNILDIERELFRKIIPIIKSDKKIPNFLMRIFTEISMKTIEIKTGADIKDPLEKIIDICIDIKEDYSKYLIIFDDLERCDISLNLLLGYMNQLVEHEKQKVIIVTNEEEINKRNLNKNKELKYISVLNVLKNSEEKPKIITRKKEQGFLIDKDTFNIDQENKDILDKLVNDIYASNNYYDEVKEKLIYQTIKYEPSKYEIIKNMIETCNAKNIVKDILEENSEKILEIFDNNKYFNARTVRHLIIKLKNILENINEEDMEEYKANRVIENIILSTTKIVIDMKKNNHDYLEKSSDEIFSISIDEKNMFKGAYCIKSIVEFLNKSYMQEAILNEELKKLNNDFKKNDCLIPYDWNRKSEEYLKGNFYNIKRRVKEKEITINSNLLKSKFEYFYNLYKLNIIEEKELDEFIEAIGEMIQERNREDNRVLKSRSIYENEKEFKEKLKKLNSYEPRSFQKKVKDDTEGFFKENKIEELNKYLINNRDVFMIEKGFLKYFNVDSIVKIYITGNNEQKDDLGKVFNSIYGFDNIKDYFKDDIENIQKLKEDLDRKKDDEKGVSNWNIRSLIELLKNILNKLEN